MAKENTKKTRSKDPIAKKPEPILAKKSTRETTSKDPKAKKPEPILAKGKNASKAKIEINKKDEKKSKKLKKLNLEIEPVEKGIIVGPEATVLNEALSNKLDAYALFTPVLEIPTPEGAASIIAILNKIYKLNIDTAQLIEQGKEIKAKMLELAQKAQQYQKQQQLPSSPKEGYTQYFQ